MGWPPELRGRTLPAVLKAGDSRGAAMLWVFDEKPIEMGKAARNERRKIRANYWNALGVAVLAIGMLTPLATAYLRTEPLPVAAWVVLVMGSTLAIFFSMHFHRIAVREVSHLED